jgi:hypothetical protein
MKCFQDKSNRIFAWFSRRYGITSAGKYFYYGAHCLMEAGEVSTIEKNRQYVTVTGIRPRGRYLSISWDT